MKIRIINREYAADPCEADRLVWSQLWDKPWVVYAGGTVSHYRTFEKAIEGAGKLARKKRGKK